MSVPPPIQQRVAGLGFSLFGVGLRRARRQFSARARFQIEGLEDRCLLTITEFPAAGADQAIVTGPDGNLWFTESDADKIGMINPTTDAVSTFAVPTASAYPYSVAAGPDGNLWFTESDANMIGMINPSTDAISEYAIPTANSSPQVIVAGPDGNLWFAEAQANQIGMINPTTHVITEFPIPTSGARPVGITVGSDGNLWFAESHPGEDGQIGSINPTTHAITEYPVAVGYSNPYLVWITEGPDGNLWYTDGLNGTPGIGMFDLSTLTDGEQFLLASGDGSTWIASGPDGNVWFAQNGDLGTINPTTGALTEYAVPYNNASPEGVTAGPDGNIWFTDPGTNAVGVDTLNADHFVVTQQPPTSVAAGVGFGLTVEAENSSGSVDSSFNGTVTVALAANPGRATLGGTLSVTASGGMATFSGLTIGTVASGYTLVVSASGVDSVTTSAYRRHPGHTVGDRPAAPRERHRGQLLRPDGRCRRRIGQPPLFV